MKKDVFWFNQDKWNDSIPTIIITEKYRMSEYERSEYFNQNSTNGDFSLHSVGVSSRNC